MATALLVAGSTLTFWIPLFHPPAQTQASFKALGCSYNCRRLTYSSFQLMHISYDDHAVQLIKPWQPKWRQNFITTLTPLPQGWVLARKHQCTTAITTMRTEASWAFHESYTADDSWIMRSNDREQQGDEMAHNSTTKVSFCTIIMRLCHCMIAITRV